MAKRSQRPKRPGWTRAAREVFLAKLAETANVAASAGPLLTLREAPPFVPLEQGMVEVLEGCDKRLATCATRFLNAGNFRGEPHLPGNDLLVRYAR